MSGFKTVALGRESLYVLLIHEPQPVLQVSSRLLMTFR